MGSFERQEEATPLPEPACSDGRDNDGDGKVDLKDRGCSSRQDDSERDTTPAPEDTCTIEGNAKDNTLRGTSGRDVICGFGGDDATAGLEGNDILKGGPGDDAIKGGSGADRLYSVQGVDALHTVDSVRRNDAMDGGGGADNCRGDRGDTMRSCEASEAG